MVNQKGGYDTNYENNLDSILTALTPSNWHLQSILSNGYALSKFTNEIDSMPLIHCISIISDTLITEIVFIDTYRIPHWRSLWISRPIGSFPSQLTGLSQP